MALLNNEKLKSRIRDNYIKVNDHWVVPKYGNGYGKIYAAGKNWLAHRLSYEVFVGPIPEGLQLDHLCRVTNCINPAHLEPVTAQVNKERAYQKVCKRGHELSDGNITKDGARQCLKCRAIREAARRLKVRVAS